MILIAHRKPERRTATERWTGVIYTLGLVQGTTAADKNWVGARGWARAKSPPAIPPLPQKGGVLLSSGDSMVAAVRGRAVARLG